MVDIRLDLSEELSKKVSLYKIKNSLVTKQEAIIKILEKQLKGW